MAKNVRWNLTLTHDKKERLEKKAKELGVSHSWLIYKLIDKTLELPSEHIITFLFKDLKKVGFLQ